MDEKGFKKLRAGVVKFFLSSAYKKAKKRHPALDQAVEQALHRLHTYEQTATEPSADIPAEIFGDLMGAVFEEGLEGKEKRLAAKIGQVIGKWIYLVDAADDFEADKKHRRFNPYLSLLGDSPTPQDRELILTALTELLYEAEQAFLLFDEAPCEELKEILANILYLGLPATAKQKVWGCSKKEKKTAKGERT